MANKTPFLDLVLPGFGEYKDTWHEPVNFNMETLDTWAEAINQEIVDARFEASTLAEFLAVGHESNGTLKATPEVERAHVSQVYGFQTEEPAPFTLSQRLEKSEWEVWYGREGFDDLRAMSAFRAPDPKHMILDGLKDSNGYPAWMGYIGANVKIDGKTQDLWLSIGGRLARVRTEETIPVSGSAGIRYIYAKYLPDDDEGKIVIDGRMIPPTPGEGTTSLDLSSNPIYFNDLSRDFWPMYLAHEVMPGDVLTLTDSVEAGTYVVKDIIESTVVPGTSTQMSIMGTFPVGGISGINYTIVDPLAVELGVDTAEVAAEDKIYLGEVYFDGTSINIFPSDTVAIRPRHFRDVFVGEWREVDLTTGIPNLGTAVPGKIETKYGHNLGTDTIDITIQVSAANDGSAPVEELSLATVDSSTLAVSIANGLSLSKTGTQTYVTPTHAADIFDPGATDASYNQGAFSGGSFNDTTNYSLSGSVTGSLSGSVYMERSAMAKWTKNYIWIKNAVLNRFYKDYDGTTPTTGYIRVIARRRG